MLAMLDSVQVRAVASQPAGLGIAVLARAACEDGITKSELHRDLGFMVGGGAQAKQALEATLAQLVIDGCVTENKARFKASPDGVARLSTELGARALPKRWAEMRDLRLIAKALGIEAESPARIKALAKPEHLRCEILGAHFGFRLKGAPSPSRIRAELAMVALERAFGNTLTGGASARGGLNARMARLLAGQLLAKPRDTGTDARLVTLLAAEVAGSAKPDPEALRTALLRRLVGRGAADASAAKAPSAQIAAKAPAAATAAPARPTGLPKPPAASRPDLAGFVRAVLDAAGGHAEGWPGSRKAMVARVFREIGKRFPGWGLSAVEFKAMLAEAHRTGHLVLATADLKDKSKLAELQESAITYKNTVWHLIRVEGR